jgi:hypothetical protein
VFVVFVVVAAVVVVAIGLVAIGAVTGRLAAEPRRSVFDLEEAVQYVANRLPADATAVLSFDDVASILAWHLDYLEQKGVAGESDHDLEDLPQGPVVTADDEAVAYVIGRANDVGMELDDVHVYEVVAAEQDYLRAIGAVGDEVPPPVDPGPPASGASDSGRIDSGPVDRGPDG